MVTTLFKRLIILTLVSGSTVGCDLLDRSDDPVSLAGNSWQLYEWKFGGSTAFVEGTYDIRIDVSPDSAFFVRSGNCGAGGRFVGTPSGGFTVIVYPSAEIVCGGSAEGFHISALRGAKEGFLTKNRLHIPSRYFNGIEVVSETFIYKPVSID
jgi:hypothetical protein